MLLIERAQQSQIHGAELVTNETVIERVERNKALLARVNSHELKYFGHTSRHTFLMLG